MLSSDKYLQFSHISVYHYNNKVNYVGMADWIWTKIKKLKEKLLSLIENNMVIIFKGSINIDYNSIVHTSINAK